MKQETNNMSILDKVIANIGEDQKALEAQQTVIQEAQEQKREIQSRLRDSQRDLATFVKYADDAQLKKLLDMGYEEVERNSALNKVAELAFDILQKTEKGKMTNGELYESYVKTFKNRDDAYDYTDFNIKCRPLFNSQKLSRIETEGNASRDNMICINGFTKKENATKTTRPKQASPKKTK